MSSRSPDKQIIISKPSQLHLIRLRYTKSECVHCKKHCPYLMPVIKAAGEEAVNEEIGIIVLESCCLGIILVCENCADLCISENFPHAYTCRDYYG